MSQPYPYKTAATYLITHGTLERRFRLKPSPAVSNILLYCFIHACQKYKIEVHGFVFLFNHYHAVVFDPEARIADFAVWFHSFTARCLNKHRACRGKLWSERPYSRVLLLDEDAIVDELVYTLANPVSSLLVDRPERWPGVISCPEDFCPEVHGRDPYRAVRPDFFSKKSYLPEKVELFLTVPPKLARSYTPAGFAGFLRRRLEGRIEGLNRQHHLEGKRYLGKRGLRQQSIHDAPRTPRAGGRIRPLVATRDRALRKRALEAIREFRRDHRRAREAFRAGDRDAVFPDGTYKMRRDYQVTTRDPPSSW